MSSQSLTEKLQLKDEKNVLIQGLPSSIEKQFLKLSFSKNLTPLLKARKIDFALVFAISQKQLKDILADVVPALREDAKLWVAYPKATSKITSDLTREANWAIISHHGFESVRMIALDNVWTAVRFKKTEESRETAKGFCSSNPAPGVDYKNRTVEVPQPLRFMLDNNKAAASFFNSLAFSHKREYVEWIISAKREETKTRRLEITMEKLIARKKNFNEK